MKKEPCIKSICLAFIITFTFVAVVMADYLTVDPQPSAVVTKYRIKLNGEVIPANIERVGNDQVRLIYNVDHLDSGKYNAFAGAGNDSNEWSTWSNEFVFYRGVPTPQNIGLYCVTEDPTPKKISQQDWKIYHVSSESVKHERFGWMAIDGDLNTHWLTDTNSAYPHEIQIDLGQIYHISGFYHNKRKEGTWNVSANIKKYAFYTSLDGANWTEVSTGELTEQLVEFPPNEARYVSLVALSELNNTPRAAVSELNILGY